MFRLRSRRRQRLEEVIGRIAGEQIARGDEIGENERRQAIQQRLKEVERARASGRKFNLSHEIAKAGLKLGRREFYLGAIAVGAALGGPLYLLVSSFLGILGFMVGASLLPRFLLSFLIARRLKRFTMLFADAIDVIVRGVRSGLPLAETMAVISHELPDPIGQEFRLVTEGTRLGMTMEESLSRMSQRVPVPEVQFFAVVIGIQQQTGGNLADTLAKLSDLLRARKRMRDKVQAMSSEAKASASIIGSLPVAVGGILALVAPDYIRLLFSTGIGNFIIVAALFWMSIGIMVMRGMINFKA